MFRCLGLGKYDSRMGMVCVMPEDIGKGPETAVVGQLFDQWMVATDRTRIPPESLMTPVTPGKNKSLRHVNAAFS